MPAFPPDPPPSEHHGDAVSITAGSDDAPEEEVGGMELFLDPSGCPFHFNWCPLEQDGEEIQQGDSGWCQDGDEEGCGRLERRWVLWHEFMKEHAHLDAWLRLAEKAVSSPNPDHVTYVTAKEQLRKFERLRSEAGSLLVRLDGLTRRNRKLTRLFQGTMRARLLSSARDCGQRWDDVNAKLESVTGPLKLFVLEWEGFEAQREELALWLADLDIRLTEVDHLTGNTCEKLRRLQSFQRCVCENSARVNALLQRGEALIQQSEPTDAERVEKRLIELLRGCSLAYNNIARTHTRLLSMRLVFEDDWILPQTTDSGCPSESLLEEEKDSLDLPIDIIAKPNIDISSIHLPPPPPSPTLPTHEHLGLEWDPSVDIGRSVSRDDSDSSYFSVSTGLCHRDGLKRRSYLSSLGSHSEINNDINDQEVADLRLEGWLDHESPSVFSPVTAHQGGTLKKGDHWATSTPGRQDMEPVSFDGGRVRAWLGVESPAPLVRRTSCSKAVQTDVESEAEGEQSCCEEAESCFLGQRVTSSSNSSFSPALLYFFLAAGLVLLACLLWVILEPPCHRSSRMPRSFHLALRYVNGPPPT